jgi:signal transduction histidine kinase
VKPRRGLDAALAVLAVAASVALAAGAAVLLLGRVPRGDEVAPFAAALVGAAVAVVAVGPLRRALADAWRRRRVDQVAPGELVATFGDRISRGVAVDELLLQLAESLRRSMALRTAEIWVLDGADLRRVVAVPDAPEVTVALAPDERAALARTGVAGEAWLARWAPSLAADREPAALRIAPARHGGALLGAVVLARDVDGAPFAEADDRALGDLGRRLGDLLRNRQLDAALRATLDELRQANRDLEASRARIVAAADAERRRIERDLHDGAQQHLVAIAVNLGLARASVADDPEGAAAQLDRLAADVRETVQQVRDLAHGIYPPLLAEAGLGEALRAAARRSPNAVAVRVDGIDRAPADVEAAAYFCCLEALQNVAKHAPGAEVVLTVTAPGDELRFTVVDDGPGFDPAAAPAGSGLQGMADRLGAVGGRLSVDSAPGRGTTVTGVVPR